MMVNFFFNSFFSAQKPKKPKCIFPNCIFFQNVKKKSKMYFQNVFFPFLHCRTRCFCEKGYVGTAFFYYSAAPPISNWGFELVD